MSVPFKKYFIVTYWAPVLLQKVLWQLLMIAQPDNQELLPWLLLVRHSFSLSKVCFWLLSKFQSDTTIDKNYGVIVCCLNDFVSLLDVYGHRKWDRRESELRENLQEGKRVCLVTFSCYDEYEHDPLTFTWKCCCLESAFASEPLESLNSFCSTLCRDPPTASCQQSVKCWVHLFSFLYCRRHSLWKHLSLFFF